MQRQSSTRDTLQVLPSSWRNSESLCWFGGCIREICAKLVALPRYVDMDEGSRFDDSRKKWSYSQVGHIETTAMMAILNCHFKLPLCHATAVALKFVYG